MSLLTIITSVCLRSGIADAPAFVIGNTDSTIAQLLELLREECSELYHRHPWARLQVEGSFTTVASELQTDVTAIFPNFGRFVNIGGTAWDRATTEPLNAPITPATWQALKARVAIGPYYNLRIKQNPATFNEAIYLLPVPPVGDPLYFEYISRFYVKNGTTGAQQGDFTTDTDTVLLHEHLVKHGLRWRWKKEKGLSYAEDFNTYEAAVARSWAVDGGGAPVVGLSDRRFNDSGLISELNVPDGNWPH